MCPLRGAVAQRCDRAQVQLQVQLSALQCRGVRLANLWRLSLLAVRTRAGQLVLHANEAVELHQLLSEVHVLAKQRRLHALQAVVNQQGARRLRRAVLPLRALETRRRLGTVKV